ncbi:MAG: AI-2E family transporter [Ruminococcaceae bacterium]|jgi:predicted PurR-regulated permease PerM|nr:AI-2E family transporter [Oscillospiraceae bacterium]
MKDKLRNRQWYPYAVAACIAVALYVALTHLSTILGGIRTFLGYFNAIFLGAILAYIMNPLASLYYRLLFKKSGNAKIGWPVSIALTVLTLLLFLGFLLGTLIPQLADSVMMLMSNMDGYLASLQKLTVKLGVADTLKLEELIGSSADLMNKLTELLMKNVNSILDASAVAGKSLIKWFVALILSVYLLASKESLKRGTLRLLRTLLPQKRMDALVMFVSRCDKILVRYIVFTLLDALIVGVANAIFMACLGMQYVGLVSLAVAVTNLIPTFGPVIGAVIGGFILLLVNPIHALIFLLFTMVLQFLDGYVIKPKLFGNSLGVSGLLILAAIIVCGNMFGIVGILFAIPLAAILDFVFQEELLPALEKRTKEKEQS